MIRSALIAALLGSTLAAQEAAERDSERRALREELLAAAVFHTSPWHTDLAAARAESARTGRPIFAYFTRSYSPCAPCKRLEHETLATEEFAAFGADVVLYLHVTCRSSAQTEPELLLRVMGKESWPSLAFLDADGDVLARQQDRTTADFRATLARLAERERLAERAVDDRDAERRLFKMDLLELRSLSFEAARDQLQDLEGFTAERRREIDERLTNLEVLHVERSAGGDRAKVAAGMIEMLRGNRVPTDPSPQYKFWSSVLHGAEQAKDLDLYERGVRGFVDAFGDSKSMAAVVESYRKKLAAMRRSADGGPVSRTVRRTRRR